MHVYYQPSVQLAVNSQEVCVCTCTCMCVHTNPHMQLVCFVKLALYQCNSSCKQFCGFCAECITPASHVSLFFTLFNYLGAL